MLRTTVKQCIASLPRLVCSRRLQYMDTKLDVPLPPANTFWNYTHESLARLVSKELVLAMDFITSDEEQSLMDELDKYLTKHRYQKTHWDYAITDYRETERKVWQAKNRSLIERFKQFTAELECPSCSTESKTSTLDNIVLPHIHVLDLCPSGEIKAHVDSVRYSGDCISVISLLSDAVLRLAVAPQSEVIALPVNQPELFHLRLPEPQTSWVDLRIPRRSVYVMRGATRYLFTHAIQSSEQVCKHLHSSPTHSDLYRVMRERRVSVICRSQPRAEMIPKNESEVHVTANETTSS